MWEGVRGKTQHETRMSCHTVVWGESGSNVARQRYLWRNGGRVPCPAKERPRWLVRVKLSGGRQFIQIAIWGGGKDKEKCGVDMN
jgi:hypothetical protein